MRTDVEIGLCLPFDASEHGVHIPQGFDGPWSHKDLRPFGVNLNLTYAVDFRLPFGTVVQAAREGIVHTVINWRDESYEGNDPRIGNKTPCNVIVIEHENGIHSVYSHLDKANILVRNGQEIRQRMQLALTGRSGWVGYPHLHFHMYRNPNTSIPFSFDDYDGSLWHQDLHDENFIP